MAVACAWALVDQDGHELILSVLVGPGLQGLCSSHGQGAGHVQV